MTVLLAPFAESAEQPLLPPGGGTITACRVAAEQIVTAFIDPDRTLERPSIAAQLRPLREDFDALFLGAYAEEARTRYPTLYAGLGMPTARAGQTRVELTAASPLLLSPASRVPLAERFPNAYATLLDRLHPATVWCAWRYVRPGEHSGMAWDGLAWTGDRWVWLPKPWRIWTRPSGTSGAP